MRIGEEIQYESREELEADMVELRRLGYALKVDFGTMVITITGEPKYVGKEE